MCLLHYTQRGLDLSTTWVNVIGSLHRDGPTYGRISAGMMTFASHVYVVIQILDDDEPVSLE